MPDSHPHRAPLGLVSLLVCAAALLGPAFVDANDSTVVPAGKDFGAGLSLRDTTSLASVMQSPDAYASEPVLLHGRISEVCQRKGCWTILQDGDEQVRVRFKDYGFFIPTDASGSEAFVEGVVKVATLSEKQARHYAEETRGGDPDAVHGPQREVGFTATGVRLVGRE
jgi:hypothetical protein